MYHVMKRIFRNKKNFSFLLILSCFVTSASWGQVFGDGVSVNEQSLPEAKTDQSFDSNIKIRKLGNQAQNFAPQPSDALADPGTIDLYMTNFKIFYSFDGSPNCSMRFYLKSSLKSKISNISYRLKWPNMETGISFDDVEGGGSVYYDYVLLGKGCYSMDSAPNIIVNRCRIKGMTAQQCADKIRWSDNKTR